jgi:hypothetical protein
MGQSPVHGLAELIYQKWLYYQKQSTDSVQNLNVIFHRNRKINPEVHMDAQKTPKSQNNSEQKKQQ